MATELHTSVPKITITEGRIDASVILGTVRYALTINPARQSLDAVQAAVDTLRNELVIAAKTDIACHLEDDLSASTKRSLTP